MQPTANQSLPQQQRQFKQSSVAASYLHSSNKMVECSNCHQYYGFKIIDQHQRECRNQVQCIYCFQLFKIQDLDNHQTPCKMRKRHQAMMGVFRLNQKDQVVKAKRDVNKTNNSQENVNYPVIDIKKSKTLTKQNQFSVQRVEMKQLRVENQQEPQKKVEYKPIPKQQQNIYLQNKIQQKQPEEKPIVSNPQEKPQIEQNKQKPNKNINQEKIYLKGYRYIEQTTKNQQNHPPQKKPFDKNLLPPSLAMQNPNYRPRSFLSMHQPINRFCLEKMPQHQLTTTNKNKNDDMVECIYCNQSISLQMLNRHQIKCDVKLKIDREDRMNKLRKNVRQNNDSQQKIIPPQTNAIIYQAQQKSVQQLLQFRQIPNNRATLNPQTYINSYQGHNQFLTRNVVNFHIPLQKKPKQTLTVSKIGRIPRSIYQQGLQKDQNEERERCAICFNQFEPTSKIITLECKHYFHDDCLSDWLVEDSRCPTCRQKVVAITK